MYVRRPPIMTWSASSTLCCSKWNFAHALAHTQLTGIKLTGLVFLLRTFDKVQSLGCSRFTTTRPDSVTLHLRIHSTISHVHDHLKAPHPVSSRPPFPHKHLH